MRALSHVPADVYIYLGLIVPRALVTPAIKHVHELSDHLGQKKTITKAEELYYWAKLREDVWEC